MSGLTIIDQTIAVQLDHVPDGVYIVPRDTFGWWRWRQAGRWRPIDPDRVLDLLWALPRPGVVLARPPAADRGVACLASAATLAGHDVIALPEAIDEAVWSVAVAISLGVSDVSTLGRVLDVVCCGPGGARSVPQRPWGATGLSVPALRPATLARWAYRAWRPCRWCHGGGLPGYRCRRCGAPVDDLPTEVAA